MKQDKSHLTGEDQKYVVDTSVVIEGLVSKYLKEGKIKGKILIPRAVLAELEHQANQGQEIGYLGLEELQKLQKLNLDLSFVGDRPNLYQREQAKSGGEVDALIRDIAFNEGAILFTADKIQAESAKAVGLEVIFYKQKEIGDKLKLESFFDEITMSVHLKEGCIPKAKKGKPGEWKLIDLGNKVLSQAEVQDIAKEIVERSRIEPGAFIEISRPGSTIVQYKNYRIVIAKTPVSDGWEITAVRPIKILNLEDYKLPEKIESRVKSTARGVIISGTTGSGKSTFAQALAEYYAKNNFVTKTVESPRSLILSPDVTQYSKNLATSEEIHDILFLSRPDYIIFDEMRDTPDFQLYTDLRLGGSNVLGVLHAATPIDAVQRFISRLDVGMIPSVLDTIIFIDKGTVSKIMTVAMIVKVPSGMTEADLARPIVEVRDFNSGKLEFEIYSYGEETVVIPVNEEFMKEDKTKVLAARQLEKELAHYASKIKIKMLSSDKIELYVPEDEIARIIGKEGKTISQIEDEVGFKIDVKALTDFSKSNQTEYRKGIDYKIEESKKAIIFRLPNSYAGAQAEIYVEGHFLLMYTVGKGSEIKINKKSKLGQELMKDLNSHRKIEVRV